jgi:uncharacterized protein (DUF58 family)
MAVEEDRETTLLKIGLVQLIVVALLTFSLINHQKNLTLLLLILLAFVHGARLWSRFSLAGLTAASSFDRSRIFPGEEVQLKISADNRKLLPVWLQVIVPVPGDLHDESGLTASAREQGLLWYQSVVFTWRLVPQRRGIYRLGPPRMVAGDLMGIYPREMVRNGDLLDLIVYPRLVPLRPFTRIRRDLFGSPGAKSPVEDPIYLLGTREYQAGRPSRYIHWTASARLNRLQERVFEPSRQARVLFILDVTPFAAEKAADLFEQSLEGLASLAMECDRQGFAVGLATNGTVAGDRSPVISVARSAGQATLILETLAGIEMRAGPPLAGNLRKMKGVDGGLSCVLFALYREEILAESPAILRQRNIPVSTVYCSESVFPGIDPLGAAAIALDSLLLQERQST